MANRLLAAGCRVYVYPGMTHVKALAVDIFLAYTGTGNLNNLSLWHTRERGVSGRDGPWLAAFEYRLFHADFNPEWELTESSDLCRLNYLYELIAKNFFFSSRRRHTSCSRDWSSDVCSSD